jgi:hypothetical protein
MKALAIAMALRVSESAVGRGWNRAGEILDVVIPLLLTAALAIGAASILFGFVR